MQFVTFPELMQILFNFGMYTAAVITMIVAVLTFCKRK